MRLRIRAHLTRVDGGKSQVNDRPIVKVRFEATGQPELATFFDYYTVDNEGGLGALKRTCEALGVDPIRSTDQYVIARAVEERYDGREVVLTLETKEFGGRHYLRPINVEPVGGAE